MLTPPSTIAYPEQYWACLSYRCEVRIFENEDGKCPACLDIGKPVESFTYMIQFTGD